MDVNLVLPEEKYLLEIKNINNMLLSPTNFILKSDHVDSVIRGNKLNQNPQQSLWIDTIEQLFLGNLKIPRSMQIESTLYGQIFFCRGIREAT